MYSVSDKYKKILNEKLSLKSKSKFVVDNVEYTSIIKTTPKLSHKNSSMIGGFPTKTCTFEIYDLNNNLNFQNKEITVYKGIEVDGNIEYVPQGVFIPRAEQITTNISQKTVKFENMQDKSQLFDVKYVSELNWLSTHTGLEIVQEICANLGIELETTTFNWYNYNFKQPNFKKNITCREVISRLAEIGGSIAFINRNGKLVIKSQYQTNEMITNSRYVKLSKEKKFGEINVVVLGKSDANDDIYYPDSLPTNKVEWKILDNPFVELYRKDMISTVAQYIIGKSITPFTLNDFVDGFCFDMNDVIKVVDRYGNVFDGVMLNYETNSRIRSNVGSDVQQSNKINYRLAGSSKQDIDELKFDVDNINNEIKLYAGTQISTSNEVNQVGIATLENCMATSLYKLSLKGDLIRQYNVINADNTSYPVYFDIYLVVESGENKDRYKLPLDHLSHLNDVYDEFLIEDGNIKFIQRVGTKDNKKYILSNPIETDLGAIDIKLYKGTNKIYLESFDTLLVNAKYLIENPYTKEFATKAELSGEIIVRAGEVAMLAKTKLNNDEYTGAKIVAKINGAKGEALIDADAIELTANDILNLIAGNAINLTSKNITISSDNFNVDANGDVVMKNASVTGGRIALTGDSETSPNPVFYVVDSTGKRKVFVYGNQIGIYDDTNSYSGLFDAQNFSIVKMEGGAYVNASFFGGIPYLQVNNGTSSSTVYGDKVVALAFNNNSLESIKKNIEKLDGAVELIKNSDICKFNYNSEQDEHKKHIGLIIADAGGDYNTPTDVVSDDGKAIDTYAMISVAWQAIKEQQLVIEKLKEEIELLKNKEVDENEKN